MATAENTELIDRFEEFYRNYYRNEIGELAQKYPNDQKSLYIDWDDLYRFDPDLADDYRTKPEQIQEYAEEALRLYDLPVDVSLGQAHVRVRNLPESEDIRDLRHEHHGNLVAVRGIIRKATDVRPKVIEAAFECQRCGTLTRIPQTAGDFQEPHDCQGCERQARSGSTPTSPSSSTHRSSASRSPPRDCAAGRRPSPSTSTSRTTSRATLPPVTTFA